MMKQSVTPVEQYKANICLYTERICKNCRHYEEHFLGGYCNWKYKDTWKLSYCPDFQEQIRCSSTWTWIGNAGNVAEEPVFHDFILPDCILKLFKRGKKDGL